MNLVEFARPLYVPSGASPTTPALVVPSRFFDDKASVAFSSYQLLDFVASLEDLMVAFLSASYFVAEKSESGPVLFFEEAVIAPVFFFRRLILRPLSSSLEE